MNSIDSSSISFVTDHTQGAAGPSGVGALSWKRLCLSLSQHHLIYVIHLPYFD